MLPEELKAIEERAKKRLILSKGDKQEKADIDALLAEVKRLQKELDAAKKDMKECPSNPCKICKQRLCMACNAYPDYERFEWRGLKGE